MPNPEKNTSRVKAIAFVDYKPAELRLNKDWIIVYYAKNPITGKLDLFRLRAPVINNKVERLKHAKKIVVEINEKLYSGWSPFLEETGKSFRTFTDVTDEFVKNLKKLVQDGVLRPDSQRSYSSNCNLLKQFVATRYKITFALEINRKFCVQYLDWIYNDRHSSPRTRNNHLIFIKMFCNTLLNRGVLSENPAIGIKPLKLPQKTRVVFDDKTKERIGKYLGTLNDAFPVACKALYFCFIRNSELGKLKVKNICLENRTIFLPKEISKNKKDETVTIPDNFFHVIATHVNNAEPDDYVFSNNDFFTGSKKMTVRKIQNSWDKLRESLKLDNTYQFYGLKDTGITDLLNSGIPAIKVRDQARHYDIKITEMYAQRNNRFDVAIKTAAFNI